MEVVTDNIYHQGWDDPYVARTHEGLLKWKYADLNSVDFLYEVVLSTSFNVDVSRTTYHLVT